MASNAPLMELIAVNAAAPSAVHIGPVFQEVQMSEFATRATLDRIAVVVVNPTRVGDTGQSGPRQSIDRGFGLPTGLYVATIALYLGFLAVMAGAFANPSLALPMTVIVFLVAVAFAVPAIWVRMRPENTQKAPTYGNFRSRGIETGSGHLDSRSAAVQVMIMPLLIFVWGLCVAVIAALT
jgi:hypothetical protein